MKHVYFLCFPFAFRVTVTVSFSQQSFLEELEQTVALLAFDDAFNSPLRDLLDISQRVKTAAEINAAILTSQSHEKGQFSRD